MMGVQLSGSEARLLLTRQLEDTRRIETHLEVEKSPETVLSKDEIVAIYDEIVGKASTLTTKPRNETTVVCQGIQTHIQTLIHQIDLRLRGLQTKIEDVKNAFIDTVARHSVVSERLRVHRRDLVGLEADLRRLDEQRRICECAMGDINDAMERIDKPLREENRMRDEVVLDSIPIFGSIRALRECKTTREEDEMLKEACRRLIPGYPLGKVVLSYLNGDREKLLKQKKYIKDDLDHVQTNLNSVSYQLSKQMYALRNIETEVFHWDRYQSMLNDEKHSLARMHTDLLNSRSNLRGMLTTYKFLQTSVEDLEFIDFSACVKEFVAEIEQSQAAYLKL